MRQHSSLEFNPRVSVSESKRSRRPIAHHGQQLALPLCSGWGGRRSGAGRPPKAGRRQAPHSARPAHRGEHPVHVTLRSACRSIRTQFVFPTVRAAISAASRRSPQRFRVVHFSIQGDHMHLLVEARDRAALLAGVRGLCVRVARQVNRLLLRSGQFFADRWHGRALTSPQRAHRWIPSRIAYLAPSRLPGIPQYSLRQPGYSRPAGSDTENSPCGIVPQADLLPGLNLLVRFRRTKPASASCLCGAAAGVRILLVRRRRTKPTSASCLCGSAETKPASASCFAVPQPASASCLCGAAETKPASASCCAVPQNQAGVRIRRPEPATQQPRRITERRPRTGSFTSKCSRSIHQQMLGSP
jgi:REP element-mobilizing transposase RayT